MTAPVHPLPPVNPGPYRFEGEYWFDLDDEVHGPFRSEDDAEDAFDAALHSTPPPVRVVRLAPSPWSTGLRSPFGLVASAVEHGTAAVEYATEPRPAGAYPMPSYAGHLAARAAHFARLAMGAAALLLALALPARAQDDIPQECTVDVLGAGGGCVNVNVAGVEELATLYRIGPALAARIVEEREAGGPFDAMYQLAERVKGVGGLTVCYNQRAILFRGPTTRTEKLKPEPELVDACRATDEPADYCHDC